MSKDKNHVECFASTSDVDERSCALLTEGIRLDVAEGSTRRARGDGGRRRRPNLGVVQTVLFDLRCVVLNLRPAALCNLLPPSASTLSSRTATAIRTVVDDLVRTHRRTTSHGIRLLDSEDCLLVIDCNTLASWAPMPRGIRFVDRGVRWMDETEQRALEAQFQRLARRLEDSSYGSVSRDSKVSLMEVLREADVTVEIPTVYGYVLGYPCTYEVVSRDHGGVVSRWLSSTTLVFYYLRARWVGLSGRWDQRADEAATAVLLSFSVPRQLVDGSDGFVWEAWLRAWHEGMVRRGSNGTNGTNGTKESNENSMLEVELATEVANHRHIAI